MIRAASAALLLALAAAPAAAQTLGPLGGPTPQLKREVTVAGDLVRIGDLITNAGPAAATPIFRAPDLGQTGALPAQRVLDAALSHGLLLVDSGGITEVSVTRAARVIAADDIRDRVASALTSRYALGERKNLKIVFDREVRPIEIEPSVTAELGLARIGYDASTRRFDVTFELGDGARRAWRYAGTAVETVEVAVPTRALVRGDVLKAADFAIERRPKMELPNEPLAQPGDITGLAARRPVRAGQPLRAADLMKPELVQKNETVVLQYVVPGIVLTMRGQALDTGAEGDTISVLNAQSKRTVQGVVTGPGRVTVSSTPARIAARTDEPRR
jgi:flagella basal body P-ring formation protein FlgA